MAESTNVVPAGAKRKPPAAGKGRPKGSVNKFTKDLKDMILGALDNAGGIDYLTEKAQDPRTASAFLTLVGKTLPMTVKGDSADGAITHRVAIEFVKGPDT